MIDINDIDAEISEDEEWYTDNKPYLVPFIKFNNLNLTDLTTIVDNPNKNKILFIDIESNFDIFTNKYGYLREKLVKTNHADNNDGILGIKWVNVAKDFRGIGINNDLFGARFLIATYNNKKYVSWWDGEYYEDGFVIFNTDSVNKIKKCKQTD